MLIITSNAGIQLVDVLFKQVMQTEAVIILKKEKVNYFAGLSACSNFAAAQIGVETQEVTHCWCF